MKTSKLKSTAIAAAIMLAASAAHAQAQPTNLDPGKFSLTWYGIADVALVSADSGFGAKTRVDGGGSMQASRLGVKASRAFSDGITAFGQLETGVVFDTGGAGAGAPGLGVNVTTASSGGTGNNGSRLFARLATAGLSGGFGSVGVGRQYTGSYVAVAAVGSAWGDGFYANEAAFLPKIGGMPTRVDNSIVYTSPNMGGVVAIATYTSGAENNVAAPTAVGTTTVTDKSGQGFDLAVRFSSGPLNLAASTWNVNNTSYVTATETGLAKKTGAQLVGNYDLGVAYVAAAYVTGKISGGNYENATAALSKASGWSVSSRFPFGADNRHNLFISYTTLNDASSQNKDGKLIGGAYWYQLEANTRLFAQYGQLKNNPNATYSMLDAGNLVGDVTSPGKTAKGMTFGVNYNF